MYICTDRPTPVDGRAHATTTPWHSAFRVLVFKGGRVEGGEGFMSDHARVFHLKFFAPRFSYEKRGKFTPGSRNSPTFWILFNV